LGLLAVIAFVIIFFVISDYGLYSVYKLRRRKSQLEENIARLEKEQKALKEEIKRLKTDPEYIEKVVRNKYRMARKGEEVFRVIEQKSDSSN